jgi:replicative DNA helicase
MLSRARSLSSNKFEDFSKFRMMIQQTFQEQEMENEKKRLSTEGTPTNSLPALTRLMKGFRKGEIVLLSGPTGSDFLFLSVSFVNS